MQEWGAFLAGGSGTAGIIWGLVALYRAFIGRGRVQADAAVVEAEAADRINAVSARIAEDAERQIERIRNYTQSQLDRASNDVERARRDADEARRSAASAWEQASAARREAMDATAMVRRLTNEIRSPYASIEHLRALVGEVSGGPELNGRPS